MKIIKPSFLVPAAIQLIEMKYNATYVCDTCIKTKNEWANRPFAVFYNETPHPRGSNWFAFYYDGNGYSITDAITATEPFSAILIKGIDNEDVIVYSRYRHDMQIYQDMTVDGGRDYLIFSYDKIKPEIVKLQIIKDRLELI